MSKELFYFNPTCEMAVANGHHSYTPPTHLQQFEQQLETIPCFFADEEDFVLTRKKVSPEFIETLQKFGFKVPQFIQTPDGLNADLLPIEQLRPWGWSPAVHQVLKPFKSLCHPDWQQHPMQQWEAHHRLLLSRETGFRLLLQVIDLKCGNYDLIEIPAQPVKITTLSEIENINRQLQPPTLLKTPWSASGRGLFKIRDLNEKAEQNPWVISKLKQQGFLFAEPFLNKVTDLSFHFFIEKDSVTYLGYNFFETDSAGQFRGCYTDFPNPLPAEATFLNDVINQGAQILKDSLIKLNIAGIYQGPAGIDALLFKNSKQQIRLHPCIEINLRHSMGLLNIHLRKHIHPLKKGKWQISMINKTQWDRLLQFHNQNNPQLEDGLIANELVALTPPPADKGFMAWLQLED